VEGLINMTTPTQPGGTILPLPAGAVSYCSGPTGDCWWLREAVSLREDPTGQPVIPGEVPSLELGDTGGSFKVIVRPHEVEKMAEAWAKRIYATYGLAGFQAIVANDETNEMLDPHVYSLIVEDVKRSDSRLSRSGWRERLPQPATSV
jgi:hypothetical protein